jgi:conjugative relaxase-like TrwC/TraI family protein
MLRIIPNKSPSGASSYFSTADYYSESQELVGRWRGEGARLLGLSGDVDKASWDALCNNLDPRTGQALTLRTKGNRIVGYDFNFHVPKSVSLIYGLTRDERILAAFEDAVGRTMLDIEAEMETRVRKEGRQENRTVGNMVWGEHIHFTARPVDGVPDPHLHAHCFGFNAVWDPEERVWKAGQFRELKRNAPYFEAVFHARLSNSLADAGYAIERTAKGWEISGLKKTTLTKYSRRTGLIEERAERDGITDATEKDTLGAKTRKGKKTARPFSEEELRAEWASRLTDEEQADVSAVVTGARPIERILSERSAEAAVTYAVAHCFERRSAVPERSLIATALRHGVGQVTPGMIERELTRQGVIVGELNGQRMATMPKVLEEEERITAFARAGRGTCAPLGDAARQCSRDWLNADQKRAVAHVLSSRDKVIVIRGAAGVGKTSLMQEAAEAIREGGRGVFAFAPSAGASRGVLRDEGFETADTVARLLKDERLHAQLRGQVMWIDEAGMLGTKAMTEIFDLAERLGARVVLSGDRRQHASVERGTPLRLLETEAGIVPAEVREILRQKGAYKQAVGALSEGRTAEGFAVLDELGWVREVGEDERYARLAADYMTALKQKKSALIVSPTHAEKDRITTELRAKLWAKKKLRGDEHAFTVLENTHLTEAERADPVNLAPGQVIQFVQNAPGHLKGKRIAVSGPESMPKAPADRFQLYETATLRLAAGDIIRITQNGTTADKKHDLNNGMLYQIRGFTDRGDIVLVNGWTVARDFGHLDYGYAVTSHASQGRTVDRVFIAQSSVSFPASSREQFYVSASRAREQVVVYTDDKAALLEAVSSSDPRVSAMELAGDEVRQRLRMMREQGERDERAARFIAEWNGRAQEAVSYER